MNVKFVFLIMGEVSPTEIKSKIFEEGVKYGSSSGSGLGLYIVKRLVERYNGRVWVEDNKPTGTVFVVRLKSPKVKENQMMKGPL